MYLILNYIPSGPLRHSGVSVLKTIQRVMRGREKISLGGGVLPVTRMTFILFILRCWFLFNMSIFLFGLVIQFREIEKGGSSMAIMSLFTCFCLDVLVHELEDFFVRCSSGTTTTLSFIMISCLVVLLSIMQLNS